MSSVTLMYKHLGKVVCFLLLWQMCGLCCGHRVVSIRSDMDLHNLSTDIGPESTKKQACTKTLHESIEFSNSCRLSSRSYLVAFIESIMEPRVAESSEVLGPQPYCRCVFFDGNFRYSARKMACARWLDLSLLFR